MLFVICTTEHLYFFFFNDTATTEIYTLSLHDALPISRRTESSSSTSTWSWSTSRPACACTQWRRTTGSTSSLPFSAGRKRKVRSEEHTSELQSRQYLVCRLLLEKKK